MKNAQVSSLMALIVAPDPGAGVAIPYRTEAPISAGSIAFSAAVTVFVLIALVAAIAYARHRGWATRLSGGMVPAKRAVLNEGIEVRATRRVSMATSAHVVMYRGHEYLIVESARGSTAAVTPLDSSRVELSEEP